MVLGVNSNNDGCNNTTAVDRISIVFLKEVLNQTSIIITDNRWISGNQFANTEGAIVLRRNGVTAPAGSVVTINVASNSTATTANSGWQIPNTYGSFNLNNTGDQFFIGQGTFNNTSYSFTNLLFAHNTKVDWNNTADAQNSILPPLLQCFHLESNLGNQRFKHYSGPLTATSLGEWYIRFFKPVLTSPGYINHWVNESNCNDYNSNFNINNIPIDNSTEIFELCKDDTGLNIEIENANNVSYQWYSNTIESSTGGTLITGANNHIYTPPTNVTGEFYYYCEFTIDISHNGSTCPTYKTNIFKLIVKPEPKITNIELN